MKLVYTHENRYIVNNINNLLQNCGIKTQLKNEYAAGAAGDLAVFDTWLEVWVDEQQLEQAQGIIEQVQNQPDNDWICNQCQESNPSSFSYCWNCQTAMA